MSFGGFLDLQCCRVESQPAPAVGYGVGILEHLAETITTRNGPEERQSHPGNYPQPDEEPGKTGGALSCGDEHGVRLYHRYRTGGIAMYKQTLTMTAESPPEFGVICPKRNMKMERCKDVLSDSIMC